MQRKVIIALYQTGNKKLPELAFQYACIQKEYK
jgi:hypothetical protein